MKKLLVTLLFIGLLGCEQNHHINPIVFNGEFKRNLGPEWTIPEGNLGNLEQQQMLMVSAEIDEIHFAGTYYYNDGRFRTTVFRDAVPEGQQFKRRSTITEFLVAKDGSCKETLQPNNDPAASRIYSQRRTWLKDKSNELYLAARKAAADQGIRP